MVLHKKGVAILPIPKLECLSSMGFKIIHLMDPTPTRELKLIFQKQQFSNPSVQTFIDYFLEFTNTFRE
ncbi:hypothetical protein [Paenibacillus andongensis]|uniref:hypothetical protein n=1 Tax=Paenibacillus andongensis TaxID=2975482 RepID=UPI0021BAE4E7|nr:hypothetical protein [Paenibacillus andongensis]